jgi:segregation and condensation protein B
VAEIGEFVSARIVRLAVSSLNTKYETMGCSFRITEIAGGLQMQTLPEYSDVLSRLVKSRGEGKLSQAAMEALAVVAYRQPVLRADIEAIRGVACGEVLRGLMEKQLIRIDGRAQILGRPLLYGTTRRFLEVFGLASLEDLPKSEELRMPAQKPAEAAPAANEAAPAQASAVTPAQTPASETPAAAETTPAPLPDTAADAQPQDPATTSEEGFVPESSEPATDAGQQALESPGELE